MLSKASSIFVKAKNCWIKRFSFDKSAFSLLFSSPTPTLLFQQLEAAAARAAEEEKKRLQTQVELQDRFSLELEREKMVSGAWGILLLLHIGSHVFSKGFPHRIPQILQEAGEQNLCWIYFRCRNKIFLLVNSNIGTAQLQFVQPSKFKCYWKTGEKITCLKDKCRVKFSLEFSEMENLRPVLAVGIRKINQA